MNLVVCHTFNRTHTPMAFSAARLLLAACVLVLVSRACAQCDTMSLIKTNEGTVPRDLFSSGASVQF